MYRVESGENADITCTGTHVARSETVGRYNRRPDTSHRKN
jgi:hypothetical protein